MNATSYYKGRKMTARLSSNATLTYLFVRKWSFLLHFLRRRSFVICTRHRAPKGNQLSVIDCTELAPYLTDKRTHSSSSELIWCKTWHLFTVRPRSPQIFSEFHYYVDAIPGYSARIVVIEYLPTTIIWWVSTPWSLLTMDRCVV